MINLANVLKIPLDEKQKEAAIQQVVNQRKTTYKVVRLDLGPNNEENNKFYEILKEKIDESRIICTAAGSEEFRKELAKKYPLPRVFDYVINPGHRFHSEESVRKYLSKIVA